MCNRKKTDDIQVKKEKVWNKVAEILNGRVIVIPLHLTTHEIIIRSLYNYRTTDSSATIPGWPIHELYTKIHKRLYGWKHIKSLTTVLYLLPLSHLSIHHEQKATHAAILRESSLFKTRNQTTEKRECISYNSTIHIRVDSIYFHLDIWC